MEILWLLIDVVAGLVVAGLVAPFALRVLPGPAHGPATLLVVGGACIVVVSLLRHVLLGTPGGAERR